VAAASQCQYLLWQRCNGTQLQHSYTARRTAMRAVQSAAMPSSTNWHPAHDAACRQPGTTRLVCSGLNSVGILPRGTAATAGDSGCATVCKLAINASAATTMCRTHQRIPSSIAWCPRLSGARRHAWVYVALEGVDMPLLKVLLPPCLCAVYLGSAAC
jgi:uncharacterized protein YceK